MTAREMPTPTQSDLLWEAFKSDYFRPGAPTFVACYARLEAMAESSGLVTPSKANLRRRLQLHLERRMGAERSQAMPDLARLAEDQRRDLELDGIGVKYPKPGSLLTARHNVHTQEGKGRVFKKPTDQLDMIALTPEEEALVALYRKLNYFPTPPWATRALIMMLRKRGYYPNNSFMALEPACGKGHMVKALEGEGFKVTASDIHDHGCGYPVQDFLTADYGDQKFDVVFMNPPFSDNSPPNAPTIADRFIAKALTLAPDVFVFGRLGFMTPAVRYELMRDHLEAMYVFGERVPIALGRISTKSGATDYAWYHFKRDADPLTDPVTVLIPPGTRALCTRPGDA